MARMSSKPYLDKKCPATFKSRKSMRRHARRLHPVLKPLEPICFYAARYRGQKYACLESGCAWYLADDVPDIRTVRANDPHWKPGKNYTPSQQLAPLPTWVSTITNFVHVRRASSAPPKWWFKDVCTRGLLNHMTTCTSSLLSEFLRRPVTCRDVLGWNCTTKAIPHLDDEN